MPVTSTDRTKKWRQANREKCLDYQREYHKERQCELYARRQEQMVNYMHYRRTACKFRAILLSEVL